MTEDRASELATQFTSALLTHQEDALGKYALENEAKAHRAAKALAAFRRTLIEELTKQP